MFNPFLKPTTILLGYNALTEDYEVEITHTKASIRFALGSATATVSIFKANNVRHFDLADDLANSTLALSNLIAAGQAIDFAI